MTRRATASALGITLALGVGLTGCSSTAASTAASTPALAGGRPTVTAESTTSANVPAPTASIAPASKSTQAAPTGAVPDACGLVTERDATAELGADPGRGKPFSSHGSTQCQYGSYQSVFLLVNLTPTNGRAGYDNLRKARKPGAAVTVADLTGVGDRAFQVSERNTAGIFFNQGDAVVAVSLTIATATSPPLAHTLALAKLAAGRLG